MRKPASILLVVFVLVIAVSLAALPQAGKKAAAKPGDTKAGEAVFTSKCVICHGKDGSGNTPMGKNLKIKDLRSDEVQKLTDAQLYEFIAKGKKPMAAYEKDLGKAKIDDIIAYIRTLAKK